MKNLIFFSIYPTPYRDPVMYNFAHLERDKYHVDFVYYHAYDIGHSYQDIDLPEKNFTVLKYAEYRQCFRCIREIWNILSQKKYDLILIPGHSRMPSIAALIIASWKKIPILYSSDEIADGKMSIFKKHRRHILTRTIIKIAAAFFVPGLASKKYFCERGARESSIFLGSYCLDVDALYKEALEQSSSVPELRKSLSAAPDDVLFMYAGRYLPVRDVLTLVKAFHKVRGCRENIKLLLIGSGDDREKVLEYISANRVQDVLFSDFIKLHEIGRYYLASDVYVLPSIFEHYSLACVHAAVCGLPIITTVNVGVNPDIIINGESGHIIPSQDVDCLAAAMTDCIINSSRLKDMGKLAHDNAMKLNVSWATNELRKAVSYCLSS
ncbi:MAG: glycosyltransferase family 4 protein [Oscillospiraceae bacterium]|nr:glycosyltransferase family 4 protein [Oscillospiraceae bacterium]